MSMSCGANKSVRNQHNFFAKLFIVVENKQNMSWRGNPIIFHIFGKTRYEGCKKINNEKL